MDELKMIETDETLEQSQQVIDAYLNQNDINLIHNDDMLQEDINYVTENNKSFRKLLDNYVINTKHNLFVKLCCKIIFFILCVIILVRIFRLLEYITKYCLVNEVRTDTLLTVMINSIISFVASFIVLPHTIANYLFNTDEEKDMTELVKNLQEHDMAVREHINNNK